MKSLPKNILEDYRENHLNQMRKKISNELLHHSLELETNSKLNILQILAENKIDEDKGDK